MLQGSYNQLYLWLDILDIKILLNIWFSFLGTSGSINKSAK